MARRKRCPKCGQLGEYRRVERKQRDGSIKVWHEFIHKAQAKTLFGMTFREIQSGDWCAVGDYSPWPRRAERLAA